MSFADLDIDCHKLSCLALPKNRNRIEANQMWMKDWVSVWGSAISIYGGGVLLCGSAVSIWVSAEKKNNVALAPSQKPTAARDLKPRIKAILISTVLKWIDTLRYLIRNYIVHVASNSIGLSLILWDHVFISIYLWNMSLQMQIKTNFEAQLILDPPIGDPLPHCPPFQL